MRTLLILMTIAIVVMAVAAIVTFSDHAHAVDGGERGGAVCNLPADPGPCDGVFLRWHHNPDTGICQPFTYGGCDGNANNFETLVECQQACMDICSLPPMSGDCQAYIPRWYFNAFTGGCTQFIYGGCDGNANRFRTLAECENTCGGRTSPCQLPLVQGACDGDPGWVYGPVWLDCVPVPAGWCGSDDNRFETKEECLASCFYFCPGDVNQDGFVNGFDLLLVLSEWGKSCTHYWDPCFADANYSGRVDGADVLFVLSHWGQCPSEPWW